MDRQRGAQIKALLVDLKEHLKTTTGDVKKDAIAYLSPPVVKKKTKKKTVRRRNEQ